eukprot:CAMPEP_0198270656 /NCGR_PEP_ID=MMETSP1447-20131203/45893_1 /TAXON_ID=420782 /ORGANISM="Chaetoceros dichaeta, Strain CCMP1751" /LENGTH=373 /DNA_ID=CAMNT_0043962787 /DNA_START=160 /DNA_END=1281 /DNA_ORIENTATION=-
MTNDDKTPETQPAEQTTPLFITTRTRQTISPYLPPPVLRMMQTIDAIPQLRTIVGEEPTMTLSTLLLVIYVVGWGMKFVTSSFGGNKAAVEGLDDDAPEGSVLSNLEKKSSIENEVYGDSVILFGPSGSGKSVLFHSLLDPTSTQMSMTIMSLKANASILRQRDSNNPQDPPSSAASTAAVQIVDYPGHISLSTHLETLFYPKHKHHQGNSTTTTIRGVLVVDSTKSCNQAASLLFHTIVTNSALLEKWNTLYKKTGTKLKIMVVCSKTDAPNSKNWRRMKIQLRTELEKLRKIASSVDSSVDDGVDGDRSTALIGKAIDLDDLGKSGLPFLQLAFLSISCVGKREGIVTLTDFITKGRIPIDSASVLKSRKK